MVELASEGGQSSGPWGVMPRSPLDKMLSWVTPEKNKGGDPQSMAETAHFRRSSRLAAAIPIAISGYDERGESFEENTQTIEISKNGAKIATIHRLAPEAELTMTSSVTGHTCLAKVIWRSATPRTSRNVFETGIEVIEPVQPEALWGTVKPLPADWIEPGPPPTADERLEYLCQRARSDHSTVQTPAESAKVSREGAAASEETGWELTTSDAGELPTETELASSIDAGASTDLADWAVQETRKTTRDAKPARTAPWAKGKLTLLGLNLDKTSSAAVASQSTHSSEETSGRTEAAHPPGNGAETELPLSPQETQASAGTNGDDPGPSTATEEPPPLVGATADAPPDHIENTLRAVQQKVSEQVAEASSEVRERSAAGLKPPQPVATVEGLTEELRTAGQEVVNQVREQLAHMTHKSLEILTQRSKTATEESRKQLDKVLEQAVSRSTDTASKSIRRATEQAVTELQSSQQRVEASFEVRAAEYEQRFRELSTSATEGLERQSDALVASFQQRLDTALEDFEQQAAKRLQQLVDRLTAQFEQTWSVQADNQATAMAEKLSEKLRVAGNAVVDEAKNELGSVTRASLEAVTQATAKECHSQLDRIFREQSETVSGAADAAVSSIKLAAEQGQTQLRIVRQEMGGSFEAGAQESERRLAEQAARGMEAIQAKSNALVEGFESRLGKTLHRFELKATSELSGLLEKTAAQRREESARQLEIHAVETEHKLKEGLTASGESVVEEARRLAGITRGALESLSQTAAEECRKRIEEFRSKSLAIQKQIDEVNRTSVERVQHETVTAKSGSRRRKLIPTLVVLLVFLVPAATVLYLSTRPVMRLRPAPPAEFADTNPKWNTKRDAAEQQLAAAYWDSAVQDVQTMYHFHESLPVDPPATFQVDPELFASSGVKIDAVGSRTHYWQKLRELWGQPQTWVKSDAWNTDWIDNLFSSSREGNVKPKPNTGAPPPPRPADTNP